ncbi:MAG: efflux RND transporter permease subunit [Bacteroidales bacterium]|nr:efflux RND transporter permease subunit [Bacteroidales bacterium]
MLNKIIKFSLENKLLVLVGAVLLVIGGYLSSRDMDIDVFPDLTAPTVVVMTDAHRMAAEEVERLVTFPIETSMNGATNVRRVRSASMMGYSFVWVEFDWGMDVFKARQIVSEKMVTLSDVLPEGITPVLAPQSSVMGEILFVGLQSDTTSMMDLRTLAEWVVKPAVLATGGVSQVTIIGGDLKQYQIIADPVRMNAYGVTMDDLEAVGKTLSVNSVGGVVRDFGNEYALRGMGRTNDIDELGKTFVKYVSSDSRDGARSVSTPIVLSDVADIRIGSAVKMGYASHNAKDAIILSISKQPNINTLEVTKNIEKNLVEIQKSLPADVKMDTKIFRQADFIEASVNNVAKALIEGAIFVIIILFLFLGSFRTTVISVLAIPLSLLGSLIVLNLMGMNINTMTLGGMCIAIGSLVDDAIIDVENVYKRLRQNHLLPKEQRESTFSVVFHGSSEIRTSIINATFITIVAFVPLFFLSGMEGRMLKPLGISYIIALLMSLVVAMTVTPLLCKMLLSDEKYLEKQEKESWLSRHLMRGYSTSLNWSLNHKKTVIFSTLALLVIAVGLFFTMGQSFLPDFNEGSLTITAISKPGISLEESNKLGNIIENELLAIPEVNSTARRSGRGELDEHSQATNAAEIDVNFTLSKRSQEEFLAEVRHRLSEIPGIVATVGQPLGHRIDHMLTGTRAAIAIKIFGTDISELFMTANRLKDEIADIEGLVDLSVEQQTETPEIQIRANRDMLARYGITMEEFNHFVELAFSGEKLSEIYEGQRSFDLVLRLDPSYTENIEKLKSALIGTGGGAMVPLEEVADIVSVGGPNSISRENVQRKIVVSANVSGRDVVSVVNDIKERVDEHITLPEGYRIEYGGQFQSAKDASKILLIMTLVALVVIFLLLYGEFKNVTLSAITLLNLPLAVIGGVFAIYISSGVVSIPAIIGFITLFGIATRNGILLISRYQVCENKGESLRQAIIDGSKDRLNPILMTALTSALALIPLVLNGDASGNEIQSPMAVVVLGGLLTSTLLNIYVIPVVYELINRKK